MSKIKAGSAVIHEGAVWRVTEIGENNIGEPIAQCECIDKDAIAAVKIDILEDAGLTAEQVKETFARYCVPENRFTVVVVPAGTEQGSGTEEGSETEQGSETGTDEE